MAITNDVFHAILAMDAYNRGDKIGVNVGGTQIGTAIVGSNATTDSSFAFTNDALTTGFSA